MVRAKKDKTVEKPDVLSLDTINERCVALGKNGADTKEYLRFVRKTILPSFHAIIEEDETLEQVAPAIAVITSMLKFESIKKVPEECAQSLLIEYIIKMLAKLKQMESNISDNLPDNLTDPKTQALVANIIKFYEQMEALEGSEFIKPKKNQNTTGPTTLKKKKKLQYAFKKLQHSREHFKTTHNKFSGILKQQALVELFGEYLSDSIPKSPLGKRKNTSPAFQRSSSKEIFPNTYAPYPGDPEAAVPISETVQRLSGHQQRSLFHIFSTAQLAEDFKAAFPWAIAPDDLSEIDVDKVTENFNLLGTQDPLAPTLQIQVMQLVLVYIHLMGKAVGVDGSRILSHYDFVKSILDALNDLSQQLDQMPIDAIKLEASSRQQLKEALATRLRFNPSTDNQQTEYVNQPVTEFCRLNERRSTELLQLKNVQSVIPSEPVSPKGKKTRPQPNV